MSQINIHNGIVYLAGQVGDGETIEEQTRSMLGYVDQYLAEAGTTKSKMLSATIWLADIQRDFDGMNAVWKEWVDVKNTPARATGEARLVDDKFIVEIMVIAAI